MQPGAEKAQGSGSFFPFVGLGQLLASRRLVLRGASGWTSTKEEGGWEGEEEYVHVSV